MVYPVSEGEKYIRFLSINTNFQYQVSQPRGAIQTAKGSYANSDTAKGSIAKNTKAKLIQFSYILNSFNVNLHYTRLGRATDQTQTGIGPGGQDRFFMCDHKCDRYYLSTGRSG